MGAVVTTAARRYSCSYTPHRASLIPQCACSHGTPRRLAAQIFIAARTSVEYDGAGGQVKGFDPFGAGVDAKAGRDARPNLFCTCSHFLLHENLDSA
eukprot:7275785-Pyramimonas_sp.AAC.1